MDDAMELTMNEVPEQERSLIGLSTTPYMTVVQQFAQTSIQPPTPLGAGLRASRSSSLTEMGDHARDSSEVETDFVPFGPFADTDSPFIIPPNNASRRHPRRSRSTSQPFASDSTSRTYIRNNLHHTGARVKKLTKKERRSLAIGVKRERRRKARAECRIRDKVNLEEQTMVKAFDYLSIQPEVPQIQFGKGGDLADEHPTTHSKQDMGERTPGCGVNKQYAGQHDLVADRDDRDMRMDLQEDL